jgi:ribosomal protein L37AE/L43A
MIQWLHERLHHAGHVKTHETVNCALCNARTYDEIYSNIVKCRKCELVYVRTRIKETFARQLYQIEYTEVAKKTGYVGVATPISQAVIDQRVSWATAHLKGILGFCPFPKPGLFLEIGCAWGSVLMGAQKLG